MDATDNRKREMTNLADVQSWIDVLADGESFGLWYDGERFYRDIAPDNAHWIYDVEKSDALEFVCDVTDSIMKDIESGLY